MGQSIFDNPDTGFRQANSASVLGGLGGSAIEQLINMFAPMLAGMLGAKGLGGGVFGGFGDFSSLQALEQQRRYMQMSMNAKFASDTMQNIDLQHLRSMFSGFSAMTGMAIPDKQINDITGLLNSPMAMGALQIASPRIAEFLFPNVSATYNSTRALYRAGMAPYMNRDMVAGYTEGFMRGGGYDPGNPLLSVNPALSHGLTNGERGEAASMLAARGLISTRAVGVTEEELNATLLGDRTKSTQVGLHVASRVNTQINKWTPTLGFAKSVFGHEMPNMSTNDLMGLVDSIGGGLGSMSQGEVMTQIAKIKDIIEMTPLLGTTVKNFIEAVVNMGNQFGTHSGISAKLAVNALTSITHGGATAHIDRYGDFNRNTKYDHDWQVSESVRRGQNAVGSAMLGDVALIRKYLNGSTDLSKLSGVDRAIAESVLHVTSGGTDADHVNRLINMTTEKAMALTSRLSGLDRATVRGMFTNKGTREEAINDSSALLNGSTIYQLIESAQRIKKIYLGGDEDHRALFKNGVALEDEITAIYDLGASVKGGALDMEVLRKARGGNLSIFNNVKDLNEYANKIKNSGLWTEGSAQLWANRNQYKENWKKNELRAQTAVILQKALGGTAPKDRIIQAIQHGDMWGALGFAKTTKTFEQLADAEEAMSSIANAENEDLYTSHIEGIASLIQDDDARRAFIAKGKGLYKQGASARRKGLIEMLRSTEDTWSVSIDPWFEEQKAEEEKKEKQKANRAGAVGEMNGESMIDVIRSGVELALSKTTLKLKDDNAKVETTPTA